MVASLYGRIRQILSGRASITLTFLLVGAGLTVVGSAAGLPAVVGGMILSGAGLGLMFPSLVGVILEDAAPHIRGRATSGLTMAVFLAQFLSPVVMAAVAGGGTAEWFSLAGQGTLAVGAALVPISPGSGPAGSAGHPGIKLLTTEAQSSLRRND